MPCLPFLPPDILPHTDGVGGSRAKPHIIELTAPLRSIEIGIYQNAELTDAERDLRDAAMPTYPFIVPSLMISIDGGVSWYQAIGWFDLKPHETAPEDGMGRYYVKKIMIFTTEGWCKYGIERLTYWGVPK